MATLFLSIVWRRWEQPRPGYAADLACTYRLTIADAWHITRDVYRLSTHDFDPPSAIAQTPPDSGTKNL